MSDPLAGSALNATYRSVDEKGFDRDEDAAGAADCVFVGAGARPLDGGVAVARLSAATAAAEAALVWFDTFAQVFAGDCFEDARFAAHVWSLGKRCWGQNCCLQDWTES